MENEIRTPEELKEMLHIMEHPIRNMAEIKRLISHFTINESVEPDWILGFAHALRWALGEGDAQ